MALTKVTYSMIDSAPYNVKDYGATGDGTTNDTAAVQACINAAASNGPVWIPEGTYMVNAHTIQSGQVKAGVYIPSNSRIVMDTNATLKAIANSQDIYNVLLVYNVSNVTIENGTLQGDRATHPITANFNGIGLRIQGATNVNVYGLTSKDMYTDGFAVVYDDLNSPYPECQNINFFNCTADNNYRNGASIIGCIGGSIIGGRYINSNGTAPQDGIDIEPNPDNGSGNPSTVSNFVVRDVRAYGNAASGIEVYGAGTVEYVDVVGNQCYSNTTNGIFYRNATLGSIDGNTVYSNSTQGINIASVTQSTVNNNIVSLNGDNGIVVQNPNNQGTEGLVVDGNILSYNGLGILVTGLTYSVSNCVVSNNYVLESKTDGININYSTNIRVDSNVVSSSSQTTDIASNNIAINNSFNINVTNNTIRSGGGVKQPAFGVLVAASNSGCFVLNNDLTTSGRTASLSILATDTVVYGPKQNSAAAAFQVISTTQGLGAPAMTTVQKNAIGSPIAGLIVFDTTLAKLCIYTGAAWQTVTST